MSNRDSASKVLLSYFKDEFREICSKAKFDLDKGGDLRIGKSPFLSLDRFVATRSILLLIWTGVSCYSLIDASLRDDIDFWIVYMTHWSLIFQFIFHSYALFLSVKVYGGFAPHTNTLKLYGFIKAVTALFALTVFLLYWILVYRGTLEAISVLTHGLNFFLLLVDIVLDAEVIHFVHIWAPIAFGAVYLAFSAIYVELGGTNGEGDNYIYKVLDWENDGGGAAIVSVVMLFIGLPLFQLFLWSVTVFSCILAKKNPKYSLGGVEIV